VDFKRNFVYFELNAYDNNDDNYAEYAHVERYPAFTDLANVILVNPEWLNHSGLWGYAVETMNLHPCVNHNVSHAFKDDLGTFQYLIVVNFRGLVGIGGDTHNVNGTKSFAHSSHYDTDGVLLEYQFEVASHYYCLEGEWFESIKFLIMRGATHPFSYPLNPTLSFLLVGMVVIPFGVGLGIGIGIGVLFRRRYQESSQSDT
jgi:hypothetical protein